MVFSIFIIKNEWWYLHNKAKEHGVNSIWDYAVRLKCRFNGSYIGHGALFSSEPCFPHDIKGIFISGGAVIGEDCVIFQQVTIGSNTFSDTKNPGFPKIGDKCYIGAGAKIIGGVSVGNNCRIGANAVVAVDVPDNSTVVTGKPTIIVYDDPKDNRFFRQGSNGNKEFFSNGEWIKCSECSELSL